MWCKIYLRLFKLCLAAGTVFIGDNCRLKDCHHWLLGQQHVSTALQHCLSSDWSDRFCHSDQIILLRYICVEICFDNCVSI